MKILIFSVMTFMFFTIEGNTSSLVVEKKYLQNHFDPDYSLVKLNVSNKTSSISKMIKVLRPKMANNKRLKLSQKIHNVVRNYKIPPHIILAILDVESEFNQNKVSETEDYSIAQINLDIWEKEFDRLKKKKIDRERIKVDEEYSLKVMMEILDFLKSKYAKKDRKWFARYHSKNPKFKNLYLSKLSSRIYRLKVASL